MVEGLVAGCRSWVQALALGLISQCIIFELEELEQQNEFVEVVRSTW